MLYKEESFRDKIALVTGGRSGIGYGISKMFLELGATVFIASRNEESLFEAQSKLAEFGSCQAIPCDIRKTDQIAHLMNSIDSISGRLDILINNAGGQFPAPAERITENGWAAVVNNNLNGTFYMSQAVAKKFFIPQAEGIIINIIANMYRGFPGMAHTGAARAGVENLTKTLAQEWAEYNIRINAIAPGIIESSGLDQYPKPIKDYLHKLKEQNLMGRLGTVEDIANAVYFLASPLSSYISGISLYVDGLEHLSADRMAFFNTVKSSLK